MKNKYFEKILNDSNGRVICGSSPDELERLPDACIDLIITSPPYFDDDLYFLSSGHPEFGWKNYSEYLEHIRSVNVELFRVIKPGGKYVLIMSNSPKVQDDRIVSYWPSLHHIVNQSLDIGWILQDQAVWVKNKPNYDDIQGSSPPNLQLIPYHDWITVFKKNEIKNDAKHIIESNIFQPSVWNLPRDGPQTEYNESYGSFPDELLEKCINFWSLENDVIVDPYAGSGQTIRIALKLNRKGIGIESDPKWRNLWNDINP